MSLKPSDRYPVREIEIDTEAQNCNVELIVLLDAKFFCFLLFLKFLLFNLTSLYNFESVEISENDKVTHL